MTHSGGIIHAHLRRLSYVIRGRGLFVGALSGITLNYCNEQSYHYCHYYYSATTMSARARRFILYCFDALH
jgi:hypothetical protein